MKLNCKPGDLAIGVSAMPGKICNIGVIVECLYLIAPDRWMVKALSSYSINGVGHPAGSTCGAYDVYLRPIRDNPAADESLTWKPVPIEKETA
jgi:hypothetical protein